MAVREQDLIKNHVGASVGAVGIGGSGFVLSPMLAQTADSGIALLDWSAAAPVAGPATAVLGGVLLAGTATSAAYQFSRGPRLRRELGRDGWIDARDLLAEAGTTGIRKRYGNLRKDLRGRGKATEYGFPVGRIVSGTEMVRHHRLFIPWNYGSLIVGPPGSGKSQLLINLILDMPGAGLVNSIKPELFEATWRQRAAHGRVFVFNPQDVGGIASTFGWNPVAGCEDQGEAQLRAEALVHGGVANTTDAELWGGKAAEFLRVFLMAAALAGRTMEDVARWSSDPADPEWMTIMEHYADQVPAGWVDTLRSYLTGDQRLLSNLTLTLKSCVDFVTDPAVLAACNATENQLDVREFLRKRGTVYIIASDEDRRLTPLMTALTEWLRAEARKVADETGGHLEPGLEFVLDEIANSCPVPVDKWVSKDRGLGIGHHVVVQARSQLEERYGVAAAKTIETSLTMKIGLPGMGTDDCQAFAPLARTRKVERVTWNESEGSRGRDYSSRGESKQLVDEPVITPAVLGGLPDWHAFVAGPRRRAAIVRFEPGYKRIKRDHKRLDKADARAATAARTADQPADDAAAASSDGGLDDGAQSGEQ